MSSKSWRPLPRGTFGVAIHSFIPVTPIAAEGDGVSTNASAAFKAQISLEVGDNIHLLEEGPAGWLRGYVFSTMNLSTDSPKLGIFPGNHVYSRRLADRGLKSPLPMDDDNADESVFFGDQPTPSGQPAVALDSESQLQPSSRRKVVLAQQLPKPLQPSHDTVTGSLDPLVDDISRALRSWSVHLRQLLTAQRYKDFSQLRALFNSLFQQRRQLVSRTMTPEELARVRRSVVAQLHEGASLLGTDFIIRGSDGIVLTENDIGVVGMYRRHVDLADRALAGSLSSPSPSDDHDADVQAAYRPRRDSPGYIQTRIQDLESKVWHLWVEVRAVVALLCTGAESAELAFSVYNRREARTVSEDYVVHLNSQGLPQGADKTGRVRTIFTDLSAKELGGDNMYLVCRVIRNQRLEAGGGGGATVESSGNQTSGQGFSFLKAMGGQRDDDQTAVWVRKPIGVGILRLSEVVGTKPKEGRGESYMDIVVPTQENAWHNLHEAIINESAYEVSSQSRMVCLALRALEGDLKALVRQTSGTVTSGAFLTPRCGYGDVLPPGDERNSLYVTLVGADLAQNKKGNYKTFEIALQVRLNTGEIVEKSIARTHGGDAKVTMFETVVIYHVSNPKWNETIRIDLPPDVFAQSHLLIAARGLSIKEKGEKTERAFAFAWLPLINSRSESVVADGQRVLNFFKWDPKVLQSAGYLQDSAASTEIITVTRDTVTISTQLHSTKIPQSASLVNLLRWRQTLALAQGKLDVGLILREVSLVGEAEVIKFLEVILETLFAVLEDQPVAGNTREAEPIDWVSAPRKSKNAVDSVLESLVFVLGIVMDKRFVNHRPSLDSFIEKRFSSTKSWVHILQSLCTLLVDAPSVVQKAKELRNAIKVWNYILRLAIRSGELAVARDPATAEETLRALKASLFSVFDAVEKMMALVIPDTVIGAQTLALQYSTRLVPELRRIFNLDEVAAIFVKFADSVKNNRPTVLANRLAFAKELLHTDLVSEPRGRLFITASVVRWVRECIDGEWERSLTDHLEYAKAAAHEVRNQGLASSIQATLNTLRSSEMRKAHTVSLRQALVVVAELVECVQAWVSDAQSKEDVHASHRLDAQDGTTQEPQTGVHVRSVGDPLSLIGDLIPRLLETYTEILSSDVGGQSSSIGLTHDMSPDMVDSLPLASGKDNRSSMFGFGVMDGLATTRMPHAIGSWSSAVSLQDTSASGSNNLLPAVTPSTRQKATSATEIGELSTIFLAILHCLTPIHIRNFFRDHHKLNGFNATIIIMEQLLTVLQNLLEENRAFPVTWCNMNLLSQKLVLKCLEAVSDLLSKEYIPKPDDDLEEQQIGLRRGVWTNYLLLLFQLLDNPFAQVETFEPQKRRVVDVLDSDVRNPASRLLRSMWDVLGDAPSDSAPSSFEQPKALRSTFQLAFIPTLVGPILNLSFAPDVALKSCALDILCSMFEIEWLHKSNFVWMEHEILRIYENLILVERLGAPEYGKTFTDGLEHRFAPFAARNPASRVPWRLLVTNIRSFLEVALMFIDIPTTKEFEDDRMAALLKIIRLSRNLKSPVPYLKRIHMLEDMLEKSNCNVEAGIALKLHAETLQWSIDQAVEAYPDIGLPDSQLEFERKELIYLQILDLFERGKAYERAIEICKELEYQDERLTFDYARLGEILRKRASLYEKIQNEERYYSAYFRVGYFGKRWPDSLRNKLFIYKGHEWEKIAPFCDRILDRYPDSQLLRQAQPPGADVKEGDTLYIQVLSVKPEQDWARVIWLRQRLSDSGEPIDRVIDDLAGISGNQAVSIQPVCITKQLEQFVEFKLSAVDEFQDLDVDSIPAFVRSYYESNEICVFSLTRPFKKKTERSGKPTNEFLELWTEKTLMVTENRFPGLLQRSEIIFQKTIELSPIENAVIAMVNKNREIMALATKYETLSNSEKSADHARASGNGAAAKQPVASKPPPMININPLTMSLNGAVDAPVNGG
ncbi:hypothetical protein HDU93_005686, partial [Gonapodya sp. JEL0774]